MDTLPGDYIAGFVDGEGCFSLNLRRDRHLDRKIYREYFYWKPAFSIVLDKSDRAILEKIKDTLGCGKIWESGPGAQFHVQNINDLSEKVIPFFDHYTLRAKKLEDYQAWREAISIITKYKRKTINIQKGQNKFFTNQWDPKDHEHLIKLREKMISTKTTKKATKWFTQKFLDHMPKS